MFHGQTLKSATSDYDQRHVIAFRPIGVADRSWSYDNRSCHTLHTFKNTSKHTCLDSLSLKPPAPLYPLQDFKALYKYCIIIIIIIPNGISIGSAVFARFTTMTGRLTDRQTDHATWSVTNKYRKWPEVWHDVPQRARLCDTLKFHDDEMDWCLTDGDLNCCHARTNCMKCEESRSFVCVICYFLPRDAMLAWSWES